MGLFSWLRSLGSRQNDAPEQGRVCDSATRPCAKEAPGPQEEWEEVPAFLPVDPAEHKAAVVIAAALAAGDAPRSELLLKSIKVENPEHRLVSCVAAALAAGALDKSSFVVRRIYRQRSLEEPHAA